MAVKRGHGMLIFCRHCVLKWQVIEYSFGSFARRIGNSAISWHGYQNTFCSSETAKDCFARWTDFSMSRDSRLHTALREAPLDKLGWPKWSMA